MPLPVPPQPPGQLLPNGTTPYSQQMNYASLQGRVISENPDSSSMAGIWINDSVRTIYDRRTWYGTMIRGQIVSPQVYNTGTVTVTNGSSTVIGTGTAWTNSLVNRQFRIGFNTPIYNITAVNSPTSLTIEFPYAGQNGSFGYFIAQYYYNIGGNIKYVYECKNLLLGIRLNCNLNQRTLDNSDPWRSQQFTPYALAQMPADQSGNYMVELYPVPIIVQAFPYIAFIQPPNLVNDSDNLPPFIRGDIVVKYAIAEALVWRGPKKNPYYNLERSISLKREFNDEIERMTRADENLYRQDVEWQSEKLPYFNPGGAYWDATHSSPATMGGWGPLGAGDWDW